VEKKIARPRTAGGNGGGQEWLSMIYYYAVRETLQSLASARARVARNASVAAVTLQRGKNVGYKTPSRVGIIL